MMGSRCALACLALLAGCLPGLPVGALDGGLVAPGPLIGRELTDSDDRASEPAEAPFRVAVSVGPLAEVVERIGGVEVEVTLLTPPATPPETWTPTPREARALSRADLYVSIGHPGLAAERPHLESIARQVRGLDRLALIDVMPAARSAGAPVAGVAAGDPHLWMDIDGLAALADRVAGWLVAQRPARADSIESRRAAYREDLARVDAELAGRLAGSHRRPLLFQHPAWQRLLARYEVPSLAIEEEGKEASPARLSRLIEEARDLGIETVFTQEGVSDRGARLLAGETGARVVALDPTAIHWLEALEEAGETFAAALR